MAAGPEFCRQKRSIRENCPLAIFIVVALIVVVIITAVVVIIVVLIIVIIHSFIPVISIAPLQVFYYSEAVRMRQTRFLK